MNLLIFHQYFSTNKGYYGTRLYEFAKVWASKGHTINVVTSVYYKSDLKVKNIGKAINIDGINVFVQHVPTSNKDNFLRRIFHFLLFSIQSFKYIFTLKYDVVLASSGPITTGIPALIARYLLRKPFVFEVRDLWPGVVEELGVISSRPVLYGAYLFESILYKSADCIIALSPGMAHNISNRFPNAKVHTITNSANTKLFKPSYPKNKEKFALYTGNIGAVNNSELLIAAAKNLLSRGRGDIHIKIIGDGQLYLELLGRVKVEEITNLSILHSVPKNELINYYDRAFVSVVPLLDLQLLDTSSPNKLFESLAAGLPIVQTTQGWIKDLLEEHQCGFTINAKQPDALAELLIKLYEDPQLCEAMGVRGRELAEKEFDSDKLANNMLNLITRVI